MAMSDVIKQVICAVNDPNAKKLLQDAKSLPGGVIIIKEEDNWVLIINKNAPGASSGGDS